ncbi:MAG: hypothetical protein NTX15_01615 [Candidatus Kapabacteria bacterium]|nr:hypothetical protein [Candidatus Kapabacteria bacterium]
MKVLCVLAMAVVSMSVLHAQVPPHTWRPLMPGLAYTIRVNPLDANKLYVGNWSNQLYRSFDAGRTWTIVALGDLSAGNHLTTVHVCHNDTNVIVVGGYVMDGVMRSADGGKTWTRVLSDSLNRRIWFISEAIVDDPHETNTLYAARGATINEVYRSQDCGATWKVMGVVSDTITTILHTIAIRPDSSNILFIGGQAGVIARSDDSGKTWRQVPINGSYKFFTSDAEIPKIAFSPRTPGLGYAIITISDPKNIKGNGGTLRTTDGGATWNRIAHADTSLWAVEYHPVGDREDIWVGGFRTFTLPTLIKGDSIVRRSTDNGQTWLNYDDVPWIPDEFGDVSANVWVIKYDTLSGRLYLTTEAGLFLLEEPTSVAQGGDDMGLDVLSTDAGMHVRLRDGRECNVDVYTYSGELVASSSRACDHNVSILDRHRILLVRVVPDSGPALFRVFAR